MLSVRFYFLILLLASLCPAQFYVISTVAGAGQQQISASGPALSAPLVNPRYIAIDSAANIYIADPYYNQIFRVSVSGTISLFAGAGRQGFSGDGGPATAALLDAPAGLVFDPSGNLYIADSANGRIRRVTPAGTISTYATIPGPTNLAFDSAGNLYVSQVSVHTIRRIAPDGTNTLIAGTGTPGFSGDNGPATAARLFNPSGIKFDSKGNLFVADSQNHRIRRITPAGVISTVAGDGNGRFAGDNTLALNASLTLPGDIALDVNDTLFIADSSNGRVRAVAANGVIGTVAGGGGSLNDGPAAQATLPGLNNIVFDGNGALVMSVSAARQVRRLNNQGIVSVAGALPSGGVSNSLSTFLLGPFGVAIDQGNNLYVSDSTDNRVRRISTAGVVTNFAGNGFFGNTGNGGPAASAQVGAPRDLAFDRSGNLFIASGAGATIRRVTTAGVVSVFNANGPGFAGDGGPVSGGVLLNPNGIVADAQGNIFIADTGNHRVRRIDAVTQNISTWVGNGDPGFAGDNGPAADAQLSSPRFVTIDRAGILYIADTGNNRIRQVTPAGIISTFAGTGSPGFSGDGAAALAANIGNPTGIATDESSNLYVATANRIRKIDANTKIISTIAGNGTAGFSGEGVLATTAALDGPLGLSVDTTGNVYFVDGRNFRLRRLSPARIVPEGVTNGATLRTGPVAPGQIISIFGFDVGPSPAQGLALDASGRVTTDLGGTRVLFDGIPAPLLFVSATQVNAVVPYALSTASMTRLQVVFQGRATNTITLPVVASSPGVFAITNQDGSVNTAANPAAPGSVLVLYGTGEGQTSPAGIDGSVANAVFPKPLLDVTVTIGGRPASILYAGAAPGFVAGVLQVNVTIPDGVTGSAPIQVRIGSATTPAGLNINVR